MTSPHVLLSAYQCAPGGGSVSQIGWEWYWRLAAKGKVTLVTHSRNRQALEKAGAPLSNSKVVYIDTEWFAAPLYRFASWVFPRSQHATFLLASLDFYLYDYVSIRKLRKMAFAWDVTHAVTPVSPLAATRLYKLGRPLIAGPWNGNLDSPSAFKDIVRQDSGWVYGLRSIGRCIDWITGCTRHAALILTATKATERSLPHYVHAESMLENGVDLALFHPAEFPAPSLSNPLRLLFVGRLIPVKAVSLLLAAVERIRGSLPVHLSIVGDGPLRHELEKETRDKGLSRDVLFLGEQPLSAIAEQMRQCHLFCLPSVRESGGAVLLEAMASGVPVLAFRHGGPAELVDEEVGRCLTASSPDELVCGMASTFEQLVHQPAEWQARGRNGRRRAEQMYGWPARIEHTLSIYRRVLAESM